MNGILDFNDDQNALYKCLRAFVPKLRARLRVCFPPQIADDAVEQAELAAIKAILDGRAARLSARKAWLRKTAYHLAVTIMRRRRLDALPDYDLAAPNTPDWVKPHEREAIIDAVEQLPDGLRKLIHRVYFLKQTHRHTAGEMGLTSRMFRTRHARAMAMLRTLVRRSLGEI